MSSELVKCNKCGDYYDFRMDEHNCKNGWISTGMMIDQLQVGQVAEAKNSEFTVTRGENGQILVNNNPDYRYPLTLNFKTLEQQWRIIQDYVSFDEAMKALKDGKYVYFHPQKGVILNAHEGLHMSWYSVYKWNELLEGKWTVGE